MTNLNSVITKSYCEGMDYDINPYLGCQHACIYCFARFMKGDHKKPWGNFIDLKINIDSILKNDTTKYKNKNIFLSPLTDPYSTIEKKYQATRKVLKMLISLNPKLWVLTKSVLVLRDIDLFQKFKECHIGISFTTLDENLREQIEPYTSTTDAKLQALQTLRKLKIKTFVSIGPILPFYTDWKQIVLTTKNYCDLYLFENLKINQEIWQSIQRWIKEEGKLRDYQKIYSNDDYWINIEKEIKEFCKKENMEHKIFFHYNQQINFNMK